MGYYCITELTTNKKEKAMASTIAGLHNKLGEFNAKKYDTFFSVASFQTDTSRLGINALNMRSFFVDLDCKHAKDLVETAKPFASAKEAVTALYEFTQTTGLAQLGEPWLVSSGGGVHAYWPLSRDIPAAEWKPQAENLKRLCFDHGLKIDMGVTADVARLLRVPGTTNRGEKGGKQVREETSTRIVQEGDTFEFEDIAKLLASKLNGHAVQSTQLALPGVRPTHTASSTVFTKEESAFGSSFKKIVQRSSTEDGCGQIAWWFANGQQDDVEGLWRGVLSIAQCCEDAEKAYPIITAVHGYDEPRMRKKIAEIKGPYPCTKFDSENPGVCTACKHWGKTTSTGKPYTPILLGSYALHDTSEKTVEIDTEHPGAPIVLTRPSPPFGFSYAAKGGILFKDKDAEGNYTLERTLLPYDLYAINILSLRGLHEVQMIAHRPDGVVTVTIPLRSTGSKDECLKALSEQNIVSSQFAGPRGDQALHQYVRGSVQELSASKKATVVPENMGWQKDGSFVLNERVYRRDGSMQHVPMRELKNLTNGLGQAGTLEGWQEYVKLFIRRKMYGHLVVGMAGLAAPLMKYMEGLNGVTLHACSNDSGYGKSLAVDLAASVWGNPLLYRSGTGTSTKALLQRAGHLNSLPLIQDEITTEQRNLPEWLPEFLLSFSQGKQRDRMEGGANKERENVATWGSLAVLSSNTYGMDYLSGGRSHSSKGEILRMLEWCPTEKLRFDDAELVVIRSLHNNFGIVGEMWVQWLVTNDDVARAVVLDCYRMVKEEMGMDGDERYWTAAIAAILAMCILAGKKYANLVALPAAKMYDEMKAMVAHGRLAHKSNMRTAEDLLNEYTKEFYGSMIIVKDNALILDGVDAGNANIRATKVMGRVEHHKSANVVDYFIAERDLRKFCTTMSFGYSDFKKELGKTHRVEELRKDLLHGVRGPSYRTAVLKVSMVNA